MPDLSLTAIVTAFVGGVLMFLAPCTLPLVPAFLSSLLPGVQSTSVGYTRRIIQKTILFSIGFTVVFVSLGILTGYVSTKVSLYKQILSQVGGAVIIIFGISLFGVFKTSGTSGFATYIRKFLPRPEHPFTAPLLGAIFALGWSPCAGPLLVSILLLASSTATVAQGALLLSIFSLGLFVPLVLLCLLYAHTVSILKLYGRIQTLVTRLSALFLILVGFVLLFGNTLLMTSWGFRIYTFLGYAPVCSYF